MMEPIISPRDIERFVPVLGRDAEGGEIRSPRTYLLAPLDWRQRIAYRTDLAREAGIYPTDDVTRAALRAAVRAAAPANMAELLDAIDLAEAEPANEAAQVTLTAVQAHMASSPAYAALMAQRQHHSMMMPWVGARHALCGWEGPELPAFRQERGLVPYELLEQMPLVELIYVGNRVNALSWLDRRAEGNSASPLPLAGTPAPAGES